MAKTNFEHLKQYPEIYNKCLSDETRLIKAYDEKNPNKDELITIISSMRGCLEVIIQKMVAHMGLTDVQIIHATKLKTPNMTQNKPNLFCKIVALEYYGAFSEDVAKMIHEKIRIPGNDATHYYDNDPKNKLKSANSKEVLRKAEEMYESIYKLSYIFAKDFMVNQKKVTSRGNSGKPAKPKATANYIWLIVAFLFFVAGCYFLSVIGLI